MGLMENPDAILSASHLRKTKARIAIITILMKSSHPLDVQQLRDGLEQHHIVADETTVYRIIDAFIHAGIVRTILFGPNKQQFELAALPHHHHFMCTQCGNVIAIPDCPIHIDEQALTQQYGISIRRHQLEFFGLCASCAAYRK